MQDNFFTSIQNTRPYLKLALEGFPGCGKTYTAALIAIGLHQKINSTKPVIIFDTERSSVWLKKLFASNGIEVLVRESRSLADLKETMKRCREGLSDILLIDSITHIYNDYMEAYKQKVKRTSLQFQDWGVLKPVWQKEFSEPFVQDLTHIIFTGRAGYDYDREQNEVTGKMEIVKSGIKMKAEGETAYEPGVLVLMERWEKVLDEKKEIYHTATILKDRSTLIHGKMFKDPSFKEFEPVVDFLLEKTEVQQIQSPEQSAGDLIPSSENKQNYIREKEILIESIKNTLMMKWPSREQADNISKVKAIEAICGKPAWSAIEVMSVEQLKEAEQKLSEYLLNLEQTVNDKK